MAAVSAAAVAPAALMAVPSMTVSLSLAPMGSTGFKSTEYIAPTGTESIYVYATVTGSSAISSGEIDGLQYLYYNVNQAFNSSTAGIGSITKATLNAAFVGNGSQAGTLQGGTGTLAVGGTSSMTDFAKPRSGQTGVYSTAGSNSNVYVSANSVSFLVETLTYTPTFTPKKAIAGTADSVAFSLAEPTLSVPYVGSNYFADLSAMPGTGLSPGVANTFSAYNVSSSPITLIDAEQGDVNLDGIVNGSDAAIISSHFNTLTSGWTNGDLTGDGIVNGSDAALVSANFNVQYSTITPALTVSSTAQLAGGSVPEPMSLGMLAVAGTVLSFRRRATK